MKEPTTYQSVRTRFDVTVFLPAGTDRYPRARRVETASGVLVIDDGTETRRYAPGAWVRTRELPVRVP